MRRTCLPLRGFFGKFQKLQRVKFKWKSNDRRSGNILQNPYNHLIGQKSMNSYLFGSPAFHERSGIGVKVGKWAWPVDMSADYETHVGWKWKSNSRSVRRFTMWLCKNTRKVAISRWMHFWKVASTWGVSVSTGKRVKNKVSADTNWIFQLLAVQWIS